MIQIHTLEQGSPEWFAARLGVPTASMFSAVLAKGDGKTRRSYMLKLAGELITGQQMESYSNADMARGKEEEADARRLYALIRDVDPEQVGFITNDAVIAGATIGCSPDSLVDEKGGVELKSMRADLLIDTHLRDHFPTEHTAQVQGSMLVTGREWWDLGIYCKRLPLWVKRVHRDDAYLRTLTFQLEDFCGELADTVRKIRAMGDAPAMAAE